MEHGTHKNEKSLYNRYEDLKLRCDYILKILKLRHAACSTKFVKALLMMLHCMAITDISRGSVILV